jgi:hypothetical protein
MTTRRKGSRSKSEKKYPTSAKARAKIKQFMHEFKEHKLKSHNRTITNRSQAIAIALSAAR